MTLQNERKWRNVQSVLPESFGLVARVLSQQTQLIDTLEHRVEELERTSSYDHAAALEERVYTDAKRRMARLRKELSAKVEQQHSMIQQTKTDLQTKDQQFQDEANKKFVLMEQNVCFKIDKRLGEFIQNTRQHFKDQEQELKSMRMLGEDKMVQMRLEIVQKVEDLESKLMESEARRQGQVAAVMKVISKATPENSHEGDTNAFRKDLARVSLDVEEAEARIDCQIAAMRQEFTMAVGKKLCKSEIAKLLSRKMDAMDAWKQLAEKADSTRVEEVASSLMDWIQRHQESTTGDVDRLRQLSESKAAAFELVQVKHNVHNILSVAESIQQKLSALQREVNEKMTVADVQELLDAQSTMNGLQEARKQVEKAAVDKFATKNQLEKLNPQMQAITRQLHSEIYQARYVWNDGHLSAKQTIQWSSQVVNTNADIFLWQLHSDEVRILLPGLYHLQAAFFTNYSPAIQVLVNGEPAVLKRTAPDREATSCGAQRLHHSAGIVAGLSVEVFLTLPARALLAISYDIDEEAQGFLNLRKL
ncbi:hypothetical protein GN958_ATG10019 [Phytophthora infestans]|nr:hypothetical protein GN958_ATG10019 [Phytophthora infestans]